MERDRGLIVFETLGYGAVDDNFMVLELPSNNPKRVVHLVMVNLHLRQPRRSSRRYPLLAGVIVDHNGSPRRGYALLAATKIDQPYNACVVYNIKRVIGIDQSD